MNWLKNIFKRKPVVVLKTVQIPVPLASKWTAHDQKATQFFIRSEQGRKLFEACRHKLFSDHLTACQTAGNAEYHNASIKGANNVLSFILYLATEDSISESVSLDKADAADSDQRESEALNHRV
jgi:hypothetical protein